MDNKWDVFPLYLHLGREFFQRSTSRHRRERVRERAAFFSSPLDDGMQLNCGSLRKRGFLRPPQVCSSLQLFSRVIF